MAAAEADVRSFVEDVLTCDHSFERAVKLCGAVPPAVKNTAGHAADSAMLGSWGATIGPTAPADLERAMGIFGPILVAHHCDVLGARKPADPTFGLQSLAQLARSLSDGDRNDLPDHLMFQL